MILGWSKLIRKEDPDIIIGYNTFGFDWAFMIDRAIERQCLDQFLTMSKIKNKKARMQNTSTTVASGTYELRYAKIQGRVQLDLYNHFRKNVNLTSYKLDNVASVFIGDIIKEYNYNESEDVTTIKSKNLFGLKNGHYISFELIGHSSDMYNDGQKFSIFDLKEDEFKVKGQLILNQKIVKITLVFGDKDDVTVAT